MVNGFGYELQWHITNSTDEDTFLTFTEEEDLMRFFQRSDDEEVSDYFTFSNDAPTVNVMNVSSSVELVICHCSS